MTMIRRSSSKATNAVTSNTDAATTTDGTTAADTGIWAKVDSKVSDLGSYIASVKNIETIIEIDASTLKADTINLESVNELKMSTQGVGIGVAVNVASASSMVLVKNSDLTSTKNGIKLLAKSVIESKADAQAKAGNVAVGVSVISGSTEPPLQEAEPSIPKKDSWFLQRAMHRRPQMPSAKQPMTIEAEHLQVYLS